MQVYQSGKSRHWRIGTAALLLLLSVHLPIKAQLGASAGLPSSPNSATVPDAPQSVSAAPGNGEASVSFGAPASDGGAAIISYTATASPGGLMASGAGSPILVTGLNNGTSYTFTVQATNSLGAGPASAASNAVTPQVGNPTAPQNVAAVAGNGQAIVSFNPPAGDGGSPIARYVANSNPDGLTATGSSSPLTVSGLTNGRSYTFTVTATNTAFNSGPGATSNSVTPQATVPGAPQNVTASAGNGQATVAFSAPSSDGGAPITSYTVVSTPGGITSSGSGSPLTVGGLTDGVAYTFTVTATSSAGTGPSSPVSNSVTPQAVPPGAPQTPSAMAGDRQATVSFGAPLANGGAAITGYTVTSMPGGFTGSGLNSPITITGLSNGTTYAFTVNASNSAGAGPASGVSNSATPVALPGPPQNVSAAAGIGQVVVSFVPPLSNGGAAITSYMAISNPGGLTASGSGSPLTITGLSNGAVYTFQVTATNVAGAGPASAASNPATPQSGGAGAPQSVVATAGNAQATISFSPPASNGGAAITNYTVTSMPGGLTASGPSSPITITGLNNGTAYMFSVTATNISGTGPASPASNTITPATLPSGPGNVVATSGNGQAVIAFSQPASNGGATITSYTVTSAPGGLTASGPTSPLTITGLNNGTTYTFSVTATNISGTGPASPASNTITPATVPGAPQNVSAAGGNGQAQISFSAPAGNGGSPITSYSVTASPGGLTATGASSPLTITGLTNGAPYSFSVAAINSAGTGPASASNLVTPATVPGAPQNVSAAALNAAAVISFNAPGSDGGALIGTYTVTASPGGLTVSGAASPLTVRGLANGAAYTFTVSATNRAGTGAGSSASNSVIPQSGVTLPGAPQNVSATATSGQATIAFSAPASDGGAPVIGYTVTAQPGGLMVSGPASPLTMAPLKNGTAYTFTVAAVNAAGTGQAAAPSNSVTPADVPGTPQNPVATPGNGQATVTFSAPLTDGGATITFYTVTSNPGGISVQGPGSPITITRLNNGTAYTFTVTASNRLGAGPVAATSNSVVPVATVTVPSAPLTPTAAAGDRQATVSFVSPLTDGGSAILFYTVSSNPGGLTVAGPASPLVLTGLNNGISYTFTVMATNAAGVGPGANTAKSVTPNSRKRLSLAQVSNFPAGVAGADYPLQILEAAGGLAPYTFSISSPKTLDDHGSLPPGLAFSSPQFSGIPTMAGVFSFDVTVTDASGETATATGTIKIRPPHADLIISQSLLPFVLSAGSRGVTGSARVTVRSSVIDLPLNFSVSVSPQEPWLDVTGGGTTPGSIGITLNNSALLLNASESPYQATVNLVCNAPSACQGVAQTISVSLTVSDPAPQLAASSTLLSFQTRASDLTALQQPLGLQNIGGGMLAISSITAADPWLFVSAGATKLSPGPAVQVTVTANPKGLRPGYHTSAINIVSAAGAISVPVSLAISNKATMSLAPAGVQFETPAGSAFGNSIGFFALNVFGGSTIQWNATVLPGVNWLKVTTPTGIATAASPGAVTFSIDPVLVAALSPRSYYATIRVVSLDVSDSPLDFEVVLNVTSATSPVKVNPSPAGLVFLFPAAGMSLPAQNVQIYASSNTPLPYQASIFANNRSAINGADWLSVNPPSGSASFTVPGSSSVSVNPAGLAPGTYRGTVSYAFSSAAVRTVNVTLIVTAPPTATPVPCFPGNLVLTQVGLVENFQQAVAWPVELDVKVHTDCGNLVDNAQVIAMFSNGDPPLMLIPVDGSPGLFSGTWTPRTVSAQVTITSTATAPNLAAASIAITGQATANAAPALASNATLNIFNPLIGGALAPGTIVQVYGSNLAANKANSASTPLSTSLAGTSLLIGGIAAPLYYVSPNQINAQIPFELTPGNQYQIQVNANGALSTAGSIQLTSVSPGIASLPTGLAIAQRYPGYSLVSEMSPAKPGDYLVLYLAGLGETISPVPSGFASPSSPLAQQLVMPALTLNKLLVPVDFAGLTPGTVGLYQINFRVPANMPDGDLMLRVSQSDSQSNSVILPVKR